MWNRSEFNLESARAGPTELNETDPRVLLLTASRSLSERVRYQLAGSGLSVEVAASCAEAKKRLERKIYQAVIIDWQTLETLFPDPDARQAAVSELRSLPEAPPRWIALQATDQSLSPDEEWEAICLSYARALEPGTLLAAIRQSIQLQQPKPEAWLDNLLIGRSPAIQRVMEQVQLVAPKDTTVLVTGETGTGKEKISRAIHLLSRRRRASMVSVNCGGIPATLLEDEFFGHVKGAFTDAHQTRVGRFEQANGSTIFLDEIGDLPLELQPKLLRVVQEREIHRIGGIEPIRLDVRVIAATNVDLWERVEQERFREDLFYRINVYPIHLPPLRERREDIPLFIQYFIEKICKRDSLPPKYLLPSAEAELMRRPWRGNIRELENAVEIAVIRSQDRSEITEQDFPQSRGAPVQQDVLPPPGRRGAPVSSEVDFKTLMMQYERDLILRTLEATQGNKNKAAQLLRLKRTTLIEKLKRFESLNR